MLEHVLSTQERLLALCGIQTVLAGGACRDMFHMRTPKDYDLVVFGVYPENAMPRLATYFDAEYFEHYETQDQEFRCVFKLDGAVPIDVIFLNTQYNTAQEVVKTFDTTLNLYYYEQGTIKYLENASHITGLIEINNPARLEDVGRLQYLSDKYPQYKLKV